jgi:hypothetical protein
MDLWIGWGNNGPSKKISLWLSSRHGNGRSITTATLVFPLRLMLF